MKACWRDFKSRRDAAWTGFEQTAWRSRCVWWVDWTWLLCSWMCLHFNVISSALFLFCFAAVVFAAWRLDAVAPHSTMIGRRGTTDGASSTKGLCPFSRCVATGQFYFRSSVSYSALFCMKMLRSSSSFRTFRVSLGRSLYVADAQNLFLSAFLLASLLHGLCTCTCRI